MSLRFKKERINVDPYLFEDLRYNHLLNLFKNDKARAFWAWLQAAWLAQHFWLEDKLIPKDIYEKHKLSPLLITSGVIEEHEDGFYFIYSEKQFDWLKKKKKIGRLGGGFRKFKEDDSFLGDLKKL